MKKLILSLLFFFLTGCGTFNIKVDVFPPATAPVVAQALPSATVLSAASAQPAASATPAPAQPTQTAQASPSPTSTTEPESEPIALAAIHMSDEQRGWGVDSAGRILKTKDGGGIWVDVSPQGEFNRQSLFAASGDSAWAVPTQLQGSGVVWRSLDGGQTWQSSRSFTLEDGTFSPTGLQFPNARAGWLLMARTDTPEKQFTLFKTTNSGADWLPVSGLGTSALSSSLPADISGMAFFDDQTGWLGGAWNQDATQWQVAKTSDGGAKWGLDSLRLPNNPSLRCTARPINGLEAGAMAVEMTCTLPKDPKYFYHRLHYLSASGQPAWNSWVLPGELRGVSFLNAQQGWMLVAAENPQASQLLYTPDGGKSWEKLSDLAWKQAQLDFITDKLGWAVIDYGSTTSLMRTENGGAVWIQVRPVLVRLAPKP